MKVYQHLTIRGSRQALDEFVAELEGALTAGWTRRQEREAEANRWALGRMYCFACSARTGRPESELWIATNRDGSLYVSNIVPQESSSLDYDRYNAILRDFYDRCIAPAATASGVDVDLGKTDIRIEDFLSAGTLQLLRSFSALANRSMLHPYDHRRWNEFVVAAHREGSSLDAAMLQRWLAEEEHWQEGQASSLADEYTRATQLLDVYEDQTA